MAALQTTVIGSMPKPDYLKIPCWVDSSGKVEYSHVDLFNKTRDKYSKQELEAQIMRATEDALRVQKDAGISIVTDGEMRRENYIYDFARRLNGFDFVDTAQVVCRGGAYTGVLPQITSTVAPKDGKPHLHVADEWLKVQNLVSNVPVKFTLPGPMTIYDTMKDSFYNDRETFCRDLAPFVNEAVLALVEKGCKCIQIDEPLWARYPDQALEFGIELLNECFKGVPNDVTKIVHMCCGYPNYLDQEDYQKADPLAYVRLAEAIDASPVIDQISLEDAHRRNRKELFDKFKNTTVILGVVDVVRSRVEPVHEIEQHIKDVLQHVPKERLVIAPDCGLIYLPRDVLIQKLRNMVEAASRVTKPHGNTKKAP